MTPDTSVLSTIKRVPVSYFVYSSLSFFGRRCGGELPGTWFVRALTELGRDPAAIRQTLYRMEAEDELVTRRVGRVKFYTASRYADGEIDAGLSRILGTPARGWDGRWTIVHLAFRRGDAQRVARERVVALLATEGFAQLDHDVYVHPRDRSEALRNALSPAAAPCVTIFVGTLANPASQSSIVALWKVDELARRYRAVLARLKRLDASLHAGVEDQEAFALRFAVVFDFLQVAWDDPDLPRDVLPDDWPGDDARALAAHLYRTLVPGATRHAYQLLGTSKAASARSR